MAGDDATVLFYKGFSSHYGLVITYYTYPEPTLSTLIGTVTFPELRVTRKKRMFVFKRPDGVSRTTLQKGRNQQCRPSTPSTWITAWDRTSTCCATPCAASRPRRSRRAPR